MIAHETTGTVDEEAPPTTADRGPVNEDGVQLAPPAGLTALKDALAEFWSYRELFFFFCWRDLKVRYKQTVLGASWAVLQPFLTMIVFTLLFGRLAKLPNDGIPYPIFYYSGLLPWTYFSTSMNQSGNSLLTNKNLVTKVYFPRMLIPGSSVMTALFDWSIASAMLFGMMAWYGMTFSWKLLLWPVLILPMTILALGMGLLLSALNVNYRDIKHTIPFLIQIGMFLSPVVYPTTMIPDRFKYLLVFHPVAGVIDAYRAVVALNRPINWIGLGGATISSLIVLSIGFAYFRRTERTFADFI